MRPRIARSGVAARAGIAGLLLGGGAALFACGDDTPAAGTGAGVGGAPAGGGASFGGGAAGGSDAGASAGGGTGGTAQGGSGEGGEPQGGSGGSAGGAEADAGSGGAAGGGGGGGEACTVAVPGPFAFAGNVATTWDITMKFAGFEGSPVYCDLDHDGVLEAVVPVAVVDKVDKSYVVAIDGLTGKVLWESPKSVASFAYPYCVDTNGDGTDDVIAGGRTYDWVALSGKDGSVLWSLDLENPGLLAGNTYSIAAENAGASVLFAATGGGSMGLVPGKLLALAPDGTVVAQWDEPNGEEIYSSPAVARTGPGELRVAIGTGGELLPGHLHLLSYDEQKGAFELQASHPSACADGGFVASPVFGDVTGDGEPEVVAPDYCGTVHVLTSAGKPVWSYKAKPLYATANPLLADVTGDGTLDVVAAIESLNWSIFSTWNDIESDIVALEGKTGGELWRYRPCTAVFASPASADLDLDGTEDVWFIGAGLLPGGPASELTVLSGKDGAVLYTRAIQASSTTPLLGDVNQNGTLDVLFYGCPNPSGDSPGKILLLDFEGVPFSPAGSWSGFRGYPDHDGYRK